MRGITRDARDAARRARDRVAAADRRTTTSRTSRSRSASPRRSASPHDAIARGIADAARRARAASSASPNDADLDIFVDYAHTPDALRNVLAALRPLTKRRLICVFGCGGDRDPTKRPKMGAAVAELADLAIVTSDNPRTEDPRAIIDMILPAVPKPFFVDVDRRAAIRAAIAEATPGDVVVIAGKGHEDYQILGTTKIHFDDREEAAAAAIAERELALLAGARARCAAASSSATATSTIDRDRDRLARHAAPGALYVAIRGEQPRRPRVLRRTRSRAGAAAVMVDRSAGSSAPSAPADRASATRAIALGKIARAHRRAWAETASSSRSPARPARRRRRS